MVEIEGAIRRQSYSSALSANSRAMVGKTTKFNISMLDSLICIVLYKCLCDSTLYPGSFFGKDPGYSLSVTMLTTYDRAED